jgi:DNA-binding transcriptional ArsR family regulator
MATADPAVDLVHPESAELTLEGVLQALSDPVRLHIISTLAGDDDERACGMFDLRVSKSTASHHFKVLREAGVIRQEVRGRQRMISLRRAELDERFPGLLGSILAANGEPR